MFIARLTEKENLRQILDWLGEAIPRWEHIGIQLKLESHELDVIKMKYPTDPSLCLKEVILKKLQDHLTWEDILQALKSDAVGLNKLAEQIWSTISPEQGKTYL